MLKHEGGLALTRSVDIEAKGPVAAVAAFVMAKSSRDLFTLLAGITDFYSNDFYLCRDNSFLHFFDSLAHELRNTGSLWRGKPLEILQVLKQLRTVHIEKRRPLEPSLI